MSKRAAPDHPPASRPTRANAVAIGKTIAHLKRTDRLLPGDAATIELVRTTARALDAAAGAYDIAVIGRVHLAALAALLSGHAPESDADLDRLLAAIRSA